MARIYFGRRDEHWPRNKYGDRIYLDGVGRWLVLCSLLQEEVLEDEQESELGHEAELPRDNLSQAWLHYECLVINERGTATFNSFNSTSSLRADPLIVCSAVHPLATRYHNGQHSERNTENPTSDALSCRLVCWHHHVGHHAAHPARQTALHLPICCQ